MINTSFEDAKILIVDDQEANIDVLIGLLEIQGYMNIVSTTDSRQAIDLYKSSNPDIILLDLMMPYFNGFEILVKLQEVVPQNTFMPILVLTADITQESRLKALQSGASDFVAKPFDLIEVGLRIKNLLFSRHLHKLQEENNLLLEETVKQRTWELQQTNIDLLTAKEKAEASDRLKSAFINNITHEIRTPLTSILGFGQLMTEPDLTVEERSELFDSVRESSDRLINTVTDYLDISVLVSGSQEVSIRNFNVYFTIEPIATRLKPHAVSKGLQFEMDSDVDQNLTILSDASLIGKVVRALLDNAIKFTKTGSIQFGFARINDQLEFYVKDTGTGIEEDMFQKIFEPFMQESTSNTRGYEGSGLGLTISRHIIKLLGGKIWLESAKDVGSTFYFKIPLDE